MRSCGSLRLCRPAELSGKSSRQAERGRTMINNVYKVACFHVENPHMANRRRVEAENGYRYT